ncbi:rubrerythrin family protein [Clostridium sp. AL.422]|uniref:rubrerythrin n=1 Tax=Clostridium TaxID=1485 RepID=UPI00293DEF83|nr:MULTISPECIES: rubrerythrin family protein [unclassified Clostridium]MDV4151499.1 rubrerythrin family protein [Clostridium sp. AL.422]
MKSLKGTRTAENLMKSFAGECQARTRYTYYASVAKKEGYVQISNIFMETAEQEREHAKRFYKFLKDDFAGEAIEITAGYPVDLYDDTARNLKAAAAGENEEWTQLYPEFARIAREEGFPAVAVAYERIIEVENMHEDRYLKLLKNVEDGKVFKKDEVVLWKCSNCGYIFEGAEAPQACPACLHPQSYFEVYTERY